MTVVVPHNISPPSIPPTQNSALVLEFNCLYTHDVRKKSKKWHDGFMRYHTFNKRVMVYDVPRNFIGDTHWTGDEAVQEGDQITLETCAVIIEVGDSLRQTESDISEIRQSRKKNPSTASRRPPTATESTIYARAANLPGAQPCVAPKMRHRSLNALLGTLKGPLGKAQLPQMSPFEERRAREEPENQEWEEERPPKRAKVDDGQAWNVTGTIKPSKVDKQPKLSSGPRTTDFEKLLEKNAAQPNQQRLVTKDVIELSSDEEPEKLDIFVVANASDTMAPPTLLRREGSKLQCNQYPQPNSWHPGRPIQLSPKSSRSSNSSLSRTANTFRLARSVPKKKTLLCQNHLTKRGRKVSLTSMDSSSIVPLAVPAEVDLPRKQGSLARTDKNNRPASLNRSNRTSTTSDLIRLEICEPLAGGDEVSQGSGIVDAKDSRTSPAIPAEQLELDHATLPPLEARLERSLQRRHETSPESKTQRQSLFKPKRGASSSHQRKIQRLHSEQPLRLISSETLPAQLRRKADAPARDTPSPSHIECGESSPIGGGAGEPSAAAPEGQFLSAKANNRRKPSQKSASLSINPIETTSVMLSKPFQAPHGRARDESKVLEPPKDLGPWSREAFDLFTWRPTNWDEERWCVVEAAPQ